MSPATVRYPLKDNKLFFVNDNAAQCTYWIYPLINTGRVKLIDIVRKCKPGCRIPDDPIYWKVYRRVKALARLGYVTIGKQTRTDWNKTQEIREKEIENSVRTIFANARKPDTPPFVSTETLSGEPDSKISTATITENAFYVEPTENLFALINRVQNSNHFLSGAKSRREMQDIREKSGFDLAKLKLQRKRHCPYYVSVRTKRDRMNAIFSLRGIRRHSMFKRRDKKCVNAELIRSLDPVQTSFEKYIDGIDGLQITLQHKETGSVKFIDYQTRFTDETRKDGTIARYHGVWEKASGGYNTGVMLTLTSYPPSEIPKHQHRNSLWHVDRHFSVAWNAYMSLLTKRNRAIRRDELLDRKREEARRTRPITLKEERCWRCDGKGTLKALGKEKIRTCPRCGGKGAIKKIALTRSERTEALQPMSKKYLYDQKLEEIRKTDPSRIELTEDEIQETIAPVMFRPRYMQVYEFQKNGLLHGHAILFGKSYLDYWEDIALDWQRLGQGERIYVYGIHKESDRWVWDKAQPTDARNRQPVDYLGKYLVKGVKAGEGHGLYWSINKRFFTNSRALTEDRELPDESEKLPSMYSFIGTTRNDEVPAWLRSLHQGRVRAQLGYLDPLGCSHGDPGGGVLA